MTTDEAMERGTEDRWEELARDLGKYLAQTAGSEPAPDDCSGVEWYAHTMRLLCELVPRRIVTQAVGEWRKHLGWDR